MAGSISCEQEPPSCRKQDSSATAVCHMTPYPSNTRPHFTFLYHVVGELHCGWTQEISHWRWECIDLFVFPPFFFSDLAGWHRTTIGRSNGQTKSDGSWLQQGSAGRLAWPRQHPSSWDPNPGMVPCQAKTGLTLKVEATYTQIKHVCCKILDFSIIWDVLHMNMQD